MAIEAYDAYKIYHALKLHFNSNYDFNKYNGKVSASFESYLKRSDKFQFSKLRKQHGETLKDFYIANFMHKDYWIGDLFGEEAKENYTEWKKYNQKGDIVLTQLFKRGVEIKREGIKIKL